MLRPAMTSGTARFADSRRAWPPLESTASGPTAMRPPASRSRRSALTNATDCRDPPRHRASACIGVCPIAARRSASNRHSTSTVADAPGANESKALRLRTRPACSSSSVTFRNGTAPQAVTDTWPGLINSPPCQRNAGPRSTGPTVTVALG